MSKRLKQHLQHILTHVVPQRGAAQAGMEVHYIKEIEARTQPPHLVRGLEQWNGGHFYEQHETLEWLWRATPDPVRDALKGIIQSGVGAYHVQRRNRRGALGKWTGAIGYLKPFDGRYPYGIDIAHLRQQVLAARQSLLDDEQELPNWEAHLARVDAMQIRWEMRIAQPRVTALLRRLDRAWQDSKLSVEANMHALTEEEANWVFPEGVRSIRDLLVDLGTTKIVSTNRCFGDRQLEFADLMPPQRWRKFLRWLTDAHEGLREPLGFLQDGQLDDLRPMFEQTLSIEQIVEANIKHDFNHAGEIKRLREVYQNMQKT